MTRFVACFFSFGFPLYVHAQTKEVPAALKGNDPVELVAGKEVPGDVARTVTHGRFTYRFVSDANKATFQKDPEQYGIQFDGACMKMGPLSGGGSPDRWVVYGGRIYVFASESCRAAFREAPARYVDTADDPPKGADEQRKAAALLLAKAVAAAGGAKALADLTTYQITTRFDGKTGAQAYSYTRYLGVSFPGAAVCRETYDTSAYGWVLTPTEAHHTAKGVWEPMGGPVRDFCTRDVYRQPICILKAWSAGEATAVAAGPANVGDTPVESVAVHVKGATTTLGIDPATGRVLRVAYRGRAGGAIGDVEKLFADFRDVNGLVLPGRVTTVHNGTIVENPKSAVESIRVNEPIPAEYLKKSQ